MAIVDEEFLGEEEEEEGEEVLEEEEEEEDGLGNKYYQDEYGHFWLKDVVMEEDEEEEDEEEEEGSEVGRAVQTAAKVTAAAGDEDGDGEEATESVKQRVEGAKGEEGESRAVAAGEKVQKLLGEKFTTLTANGEESEKFFKRRNSVSLSFPFVYIEEKATDR